MPFISVQLSGQPDDSLAQHVAHELTGLTAQILGKDPKLTAVAIHFVQPTHWFIASQALAHVGERTFFVAVSVTDETNTKAEKARYLNTVFERMSQLLGGTHEKSYVHVVDARATAYGYGGLSQERRYIEGAKTPA